MLQQDANIIKSVPAGSSGTAPARQGPPSVHTEHEEILSGLPRRWREALFNPPVNLKTDLALILFLGNQPHTFAETRNGGFSGYLLQPPSDLRSERQESDLAAQIEFTPLFNGGYLIRKTFHLVKPTLSFQEHYDSDGNYAGRLQGQAPTPLYVPLTEMEPGCPIASHLFNTLAFEYLQAEKGEACSKRIVTLEALMRSLSTQSDLPINHLQSVTDPALGRTHEKLLQNELDPALSFSEKEVVRVKIKADRQIIVKTKSRIYGSSTLKLGVHLFLRDLMVRFKGMAQRPREKFNGTFYKYTIGAFLWFLSVVRGNIGYSIALAIYGPFTFYFITQPMNPHAMWAVGKVRQTYINAVNEIKTVTEASGRVIDAVTGTAVSGAAATVAISTPGAETPTDGQAADLAGKVPLIASATERYSSFKPQFESMLLATDVPEVDQQKWPDRMSNFKAMQIAYEENMQFSARMGRLEQMETQLNFPLIAESSFKQLERYQYQLAKMRIKVGKHPQAIELQKYLSNEEQRTRQFKLYIWDKLIRYMLDHPYVVMNESQDQNYVDYYVGRSFIFLEEITADLQKQYQGLKKPKGYKGVEKLASLYRSKKIEGLTPEERLARNSLLATQKDFYGSTELRNHLKRQWELLFLSQNRAQEAANFGLQMYTWSVRNAIWAIDALHSAKIHELRMIADEMDQNQKLDQVVAEAKKSVEALYESLYHIMALEYVSIKQELSQRLDDDIEAIQRQTILENLRQAFKERTDFLRALTRSAS